MNKMLRIKFAKEQGNAFFKIEAALSEGDFKKAFIAAHTLKGAAGLIEEPELVRAATEAELALRQGIRPDDNILQNLQEILQKVVEGIEIPKRQEVAEWDKEAAIKVFGNLKVMLEQSSAMSFGMIDELEKIPQTEELIALIEACDFTAALAELIKTENRLLS
jgi:HPt (histidine-containing phosphotransfer) domain-containing protein